MDNETPSSPTDYQKEKQDILREQQPDPDGEETAHDDDPAERNTEDAAQTGEGTGARAGEYS